jgi:glycosyltransferase 2 family protein
MIGHPTAQGPAHRRSFGGPNRIRWAVGLIISLSLLLLTLRGLQWRELLAASRSTDYTLILLAVGVIFVTFVGRAWRWSFLLRPIRRLRTEELLPIVLIGFFGNYVLPAKAGELVRAYVLSKRGPLSKSAILGSIAVEKTMDMLILFVILLGVLWAVPLPEWITQFEQGAAVVLLALLVLVFALAARGRRVADLIARGLQFVLPWGKARVARLTQSFTDGLGVLYQGSNLGAVILLSGTVWGLMTCMFAIIGSAIGLHVPLYVYLILAATTNMANLVPALPGRLGTLEFLSVTVLGLFGVTSSTALLFPLLLRLVQLTPVLLGYFFLNREGVRLLDAQNATAETVPAPESA